MYGSPVDLWKCMGHIDLIHYVLAGMSRLVRVVPFSTTGSVLQNAKQTITFEQPDMQMLLGKVLCMPPGRARGTAARHRCFLRACSERSHFTDSCRILPTVHHCAWLVHRGRWGRERERETERETFSDTYGASFVDKATP